MGKSRGTRVATNALRFMQNSRVYETESVCVDRLPCHIISESELDSVKQQWDVFLSSVYVMTQKQHTKDWFLSCMFQFTSTTFHVLINVVYALYLDTEDIKELHAKCKAIICLAPRNRVTLANAVSLIDDDVPNQRNDLIIGREPEKTYMPRVANHNNCTKEFWMRKCKLKSESRL